MLDSIDDLSIETLSFFPFEFFSFAFRSRLVIVYNEFTPLSP